MSIRDKTGSGVKLALDQPELGFETGAQHLSKRNVHFLNSRGQLTGQAEAAHHVAAHISR